MRLRFALLVLILAGVLVASIHACKKDPEPAPIKPVVSATPSVAATASAGPAESAPPVASATNTPTPPPHVGANAPLPVGEGMSAKGETWDVEVPAPRTCEHGLECNLVVRISAKKGFHVNKEYPTKLTMDETAGIEMLGKDAKGKNIFSKAAGDFTLDGETIGTMLPKFKASTAGQQKLSGTLKFSVCSAANCQMETAQIKATVPVR